MVEMVARVLVTSATVTSASPKVLAVEGGTEVVVTGTGFAGDAAVCRVDPAPGGSTHLINATTPNFNASVSLDGGETWVGAGVEIAYAEQVSVALDRRPYVGEASGHLLGWYVAATSNVSWNNSLERLADVIVYENAPKGINQGMPYGLSAHPPKAQLAFLDAVHRVGFKVIYPVVSGNVSINHGGPFDAGPAAVLDVVMQENYGGTLAAHAGTGAWAGGVGGDGWFRNGAAFEPVYNCPGAFAWKGTADAHLASMWLGAIDAGMYSDLNFIYTEAEYGGPVYPGESTASDAWQLAEQQAIFAEHVAKESAEEKKSGGEDPSRGRTERRSGYQKTSACLACTHQLRGDVDVDAYLARHDRFHALPLKADDHAADMKLLADPREAPGTSSRRSLQPLFTDDSLGRCGPPSPRPAWSGDGSLKQLRRYTLARLYGVDARFRANSDYVAFSLHRLAAYGCAKARGIVAGLPRPVVHFPEAAERFAAAGLVEVRLHEAILGGPGPGAATRRSAARASRRGRWPRRRTRGDLGTVLMRPVKDKDVGYRVDINFDGKKFQFSPGHQCHRLDVFPNSGFVVGDEVLLTKEVGAACGARGTIMRRGFDPDDSSKVVVAVGAIGGEVQCSVISELVHAPLLEQSLIAKGEIVGDKVTSRARSTRGRVGVIVGLAFDPEKRDDGWLRVDFAGSARDCDSNKLEHAPLVTHSRCKKYDRVKAKVNSQASVIPIFVGDLGTVIGARRDLRRGRGKPDRVRSSLTSPGYRLEVATGTPLYNIGSVEADYRVPTPARNRF
ncbi:hypothetical protein JL722_9347 [Aureococcus anophagefferens]|nr:hypothetical protein JL722_9347 [Aureococcus anophagefferens]